MTDSRSASVLLLANFDSGLKFARRVADALAAQGASVQIAAPTTVAPHSLSPSSLGGAHPVTVASWSDLVARSATVDVVVPVFDGTNIERFISEVHELRPRALPVFGAAYVGMALYDVAPGYLRRVLADVIAVNSRTDLALFAKTAHNFGLPDGNLLLAGLALLPAAPLPLRTGPIDTVVYADQPTVPSRIPQRAYLWDRLVGYAERHPDRTVLLRPRHRPGEDTFHRMEFSPDEWAAHREFPPNFRVDHTPIATLLPQTDLLLTVSSTAALEAIAGGSRVAFVADVLNDGALNPPLLPSGLLRMFDAIDADEIGTPDAEWLDDVFPAQTGDAPAERFAARLLEIAGDRTLRTHDASWSSGFQVARRAAQVAFAGMPTGNRRRYTPRRVAAGVLRRALRRIDR
jgi:hypothetical protein